MQTGRIRFNSYQLETLGAFSFTTSSSHEQAGRASRTVETIDVTIHLSQNAPSTQRAKLEKVREVLDRSEGELIIEDENAYQLSYIAQPLSSNLESVINGNENKIKIQFRTWKIIGGGNNSIPATFQWTDASSTPHMLTIHNTEGWSETINTTRSDERSAHRKLTSVTITFKGRAYYADPSQSYADRLNYLTTQRNVVNDSMAPDGTLTYANFSKIVQVTSITANIDANAEFLEISLQVRYAALPDDNTAEAEWEVDSSTNTATGEITTRVSGSIEAPDKASAEAKLSAILATYHTSYRRLTSKQARNSYADGADSPTTPSWYGLNFTLEFAENDPSATGYTLSINPSEDASGGRISYTGNVRAATLAAAMAKVQELAENKHPVEVSRTTTTEFQYDTVDASERFVQIQFTYTYAVSALLIRGTITSANTKPFHGDYETTISGSITAPTEAEARAHADTYKPSGVVILQNDESVASSTESGDNQFTTLSFTFRHRNIHTQTAIQNKSSESHDYKQMTKTTTMSGSIHAANHSTAMAAYQQIRNSMPDTLISESNSKDEDGESAGSLSFIKLDYTFTSEGKTTGNVGTDIINANWTLTRVGQVENIPITPIITGFPVQQGGFGYNIGRLTASGRVTARTITAAKQWGQAKHSEVTGGAEDPPQESITTNHREMSGTDVLNYEFSFTYAARFANGLTGLM